MMIADAIRSANTKHEIYFLLTAYIRTMPFSDQLSRMPEPITRLPLNGIPDVRSRFGKLMVELDTASKRLDDPTCSSIKGAMHVFGTSLNRLVVLDDDASKSGKDVRLS